MPLPNNPLEDPPYDPADEMMREHSPPTQYDPNGNPIGTWRYVNGDDDD